MRKIYVKRERALACFALSYHCVLGQTLEEHLQWAANRERQELMLSRAPGTVRSGETVCLEVDEGESSLFVIAYREQGELFTETLPIPAGSEDLFFTIITEFDGNRHLALRLTASEPFSAENAVPSRPAPREKPKCVKEPIAVNDYAEHIMKMLKKGVLLNTNGDKFNAMVIGWGHLGTVWGMDSFIVYVREGRYTKGQLDRTGEFTVSVPLEGPDPTITRVCGSRSGREIDKASEAGLTLEEPAVIRTPGVREYPLTLECQVLYAQPQDLSLLPEEIRERMYPRDVPGTEPMANRDAHTAYIGKIVSAYILRT